MNARELAERFHEAYERLAPQFGYTTRLGTRVFDPESDNGRLMIAVVEEVCGTALRLLAAAEANDGTGCELIENLRTEADLCRNETATDIADLLDDAASALIATGAQFNALKDERNGLAARVGELEALVANNIPWAARGSKP